MFSEGSMKFPEGSRNFLVGSMKIREGSMTFGKHKVVDGARGVAYCGVRGQGRGLFLMA